MKRKRLALFLILVALALSACQPKTVIVEKVVTPEARAGISDVRGHGRVAAFRDMTDTGRFYDPEFHVLCYRDATGLGCVWLPEGERP